MLTNVTFSLREDTVRRLRKAARDAGGGRKGAISELVEAAIEERLKELEWRTAKEEFAALLNGKEIARAPTLRELSSKLGGLGVDPREVNILGGVSIEPTVRTGVRVPD